jgi:anti-anti-sigma factor
LSEFQPSAFTESFESSRKRCIADRIASAPPPAFEIQESRVDGWVRLSLSGDLDFASTPKLEDRLARLRALKSPVRLNLGALQFIDSTAIHLLVRTVGEARLKRWPLEIERDISAPVMRLLKLVRLDHWLLDSVVILPPPGRGRLHPTSSEAPPAT